MAENNADKKLKCSECSMKCLKRNLTKHMDNAHKPCPYCEYNTKIGTENINNHIKDNHPDLDTIELDKPDQTDCYICSSKMSKYYLKTHMKINHKKCQYCEYLTKNSKEKLMHHIIFVHPDKVNKSDLEVKKLIKCQYCPRKFKRATLIKHIKAVHFYVQCPVCNSVQQTKENFEEHMKSNHPEATIYNNKLFK